MATLRAELERVRARSAEPGVASRLGADGRSRVADELQRSEVSLRAGLEYVGLRQLAAAKLEVHRSAYLADHATVTTPEANISSNFSVFSMDSDT